ncbi:hypothetical protein J2Z58_002016 [Halobacillus andaensis]|nr:hypothetical protein [Halobacillus andaensis]
MFVGIIIVPTAIIEYCRSSMGKSIPFIGETAKKSPPSADRGDVCYRMPIEASKMTTATEITGISTATMKISL